jgi:hypothetical protein
MLASVPVGFLNLIRRRRGIHPDSVFSGNALGAGSSKSDVFRGVNARRRSVHGQDKHLNERCSYPGALIAFAGTTCTKCIIAPHAIQRMETTRLNARTSSSVEGARHVKQTRGIV